MKPSGRKSVRPLYLLFAATGAAGLIYEVVSFRLLRLTLGGTAHAATAVLCAFMGGMAAGSFAGAALARRSKRPARSFAMLQWGMAAMFAALPAALAAIRPLNRAAFLRFGASAASMLPVQFILSVIILAAPCALMGATLPFITRAAKTGGQAEDRAMVARLYGLNSLGAASGALLAAFLLIPSLGTHGALYAGCALGAAAGAFAWRLHRAPVPPAGAAAESGRSSGNAGLLLPGIAYALAGAATMICEVGWTRALSAMIGSSVYAFSLMLSVFILGLSLGSLAAVRLAARRDGAASALAAIEAGIALACLVSMPVFERLPVWFMAWIADRTRSFWLLQCASMGAAAIVMLPPALLMGAAFPLAARVIANRGSAAEEQAAGLAAGFGTVGNVAGVLAGGLVLLPWIGVRNTLLAAAGASALSACLFIAAAPDLRRKPLLIPALLAAVAAGIAFTPPWDASAITFAPLVRAVRHAGSGGDPATMMPGRDGLRPLFHREGVSATVEVKETDTGERVLFVDGKPDASTAGDLPTQVMIAHLPLLLHPRPRDVMVLGLASGITVGSAATHPVEHITCAEIEPAIVDACRFFDEHNRHALDDRRLRLVVADGRTLLDADPRRYDVIISQPTNPWIAGMGDLFSLEFFRLCRERLNDDGIACVWVDSYTLGPDMFRGVAATFASVFPHMQLWSFLRSDYVLVGSCSPISARASDLASGMTVPVTADLARAGVASAPDLLAGYVAGRAGLEALADGASVHTDDSARIESLAPRSMLDPDGRFRILELAENVRDTGFPFVEDSGNGLLLEQAATFSRARALVLSAALRDWRGEPDSAWSALREAAALNPNDSFLARAVRSKLRKASRQARRGAYADSETTHRRVLEARPDSAAAHYGLAYVLDRTARSAEALEHYRAAALIDPANAVYQAGLGDSAYRLRRAGEAAAAYRSALAAKPGDPAVLNNLAWLLASVSDSSVRDIPEALRLALHACETTQWRSAHVVETLARIRLVAGDSAGAVAAWDRAIAAAGPEARPTLEQRREEFSAAARKLEQIRTP
ncbi:MAG: hypothetical protein FJ224_01630 [Lentisphaerae bacterium]|nr:hypothetical protein [Lentisphaerota bacterium]